MSDSTLELTLPNATIALHDAGTALRDSPIIGVVPDVGAISEPALLAASEPDVIYGLHDTLRRAGVETLTVDADALETPSNAVGAILRAGHDELRARGLPDPDINLYLETLDEARGSNTDFHQALEDRLAREPLSMRTDLSGPEPTFSLSDNLTDTTTNVLVQDGPVGASQDYDVHFMAYPIAYKEVLGVPVIDSQPSHAFVVVTEPGGDPLDRDDVLIATRAGPDNATQTVYLPDSSLPDGEQSKDEMTNNGNVYVSDQDFTIANDVEHPGAFHVETTTVTGDLNDMQGLVDGHRRFINGEDIDYELLNRNSNTYAGDVYEMLTGNSPPNFEYARMNLRYFPAVNNDLVDYSKTPYAEHFDDAAHGSNQSQALEEEANFAYGMD